MATKDSFRKYLEAGSVLGQLARARTEEVVRDLVDAGSAQREQVQDWVDDLVARGAKASGQVVDGVRTEINNQLVRFGVTDVEDLAHEVLGLLKHQVNKASAPAKKAGGAAKKASAPAKKAAGEIKLPTAFGGDSD